MEPAPRDVDEAVADKVEFFWGRCAIGNSWSGAFFPLRSLKKGAEDWGFLMVDVGLGWETRSWELASDLGDSD